MRWRQPHSTAMIIIIIIKGKKNLNQRKSAYTTKWATTRNALETFFSSFVFHHWLVAVAFALCDIRTISVDIFLQCICFIVSRSFATNFNIELKRTAYIYKHTHASKSLSLSFSQEQTKKLYIRCNCLIVNIRVG